MPAGPRHRIQTSKQAKAAFKARGYSTVSSSQQKRIERGAVLLERAERQKAQEERRKEWAKRKENEQKVESCEGPNLGSERKLDRFGYASSQFHLGKFFAAKPQAAKTVTKIEQHSKFGKEQETVTHPDDVQQPPCTTIDPQLASLFTKSSQLDRELSLSPLSPVIPTPAAASSARGKLASISFSSEDGLFDAQTLAELDRVVDARLACINEEPAQQSEREAGSMLPPALQVLSPRILAVYGISAEDLECLAGDDVQLTQVDV